MEEISKPGGGVFSAITGGAGKSFMDEYMTDPNFNTTGKSPVSYGIGGTGYTSASTGTTASYGHTVTHAEIAAAKDAIYDKVKRYEDEKARYLKEFISKSSTNPPEGEFDNPLDPKGNAIHNVPPSGELVMAMAISRGLKDMLDAATERSRQCDEDWSKNPGGIDFSPGRVAKRPVESIIRQPIPYSVPDFTVVSHSPDALSPNPEAGTW